MLENLCYMCFRPYILKLGLFATAIRFQYYLVSRVSSICLMCSLLNVKRYKTNQRFVHRNYQSSIYGYFFVVHHFFQIFLPPQRCMRQKHEAINVCCVLLTYSVAQYGNFYITKMKNNTNEDKFILFVNYLFRFF